MASPQEYRQWLTDRQLPVSPSNINRVAALMAADQIAASGNNATPDRLAATGNVDRMLGEFDTRSNGSSQRAGASHSQARSDVQPTVAGSRPVPADTRASRGGNGIVSPPGARNEPQTTQQSVPFQTAASGQAPAATSSPDAIAASEEQAARGFDTMNGILSYLTGRPDALTSPNPIPSPAQANIDSTIAASMPGDSERREATQGIVDSEAAEARSFDEAQAAGVYDRGMQALQPSNGNPIDTSGLSPGEWRVLEALGLGGAALGGGAALRHATSPPPPVQVGAPPPPRGPRPPPMPMSSGPPMPPSLPAAPVQPMPPTGAPRNVQGQVPPNMPPSATVPQSPIASRVGVPMSVNGGSAVASPAGGEPVPSNVPTRGPSGMQPSPRGVVNRGTGSVVAPPPATAGPTTITRPAGGGGGRRGQFDRPWWVETPLR